MSALQVVVLRTPIVTTFWRTAGDLHTVAAMMIALINGRRGVSCHGMARGRAVSLTRCGFALQPQCRASDLKSIADPAAHDFNVNRKDQSVPPK